MIYTVIITTSLTPLSKLPASASTGLAWTNRTVIGSPEQLASIFAEIRERRQQPIPSTPFPLGNNVYQLAAEGMSWLNKTVLANPLRFEFLPRQYPDAFLPLSDMVVSTTPTPTRYAIELRDKDFRLKDRFENSVTSLQWEWNRIGGCGRCSFTIDGDYLRVAVAADDDIRIYLPNSTTGATLWYRGYVETVIPQLTGGNKGSIRIECVGYFNWLDRIIVYNTGSIKTYTSQEVSLIVQDIIDNFVVVNSSITRGTIDASTFIPDTLEFKVTAREALRTLFDLIGSVEYGVDTSLVFYWRDQSETVAEKFYIGGNITKLSDRVDFKNIVNKIYLEGGEASGVAYVPTAATAQDSIDRYGLHEEIISNASIVTSVVASRYMSSIFLQRAKASRQLGVTLKNITRRFEATLPMGAIAVVDQEVEQLRYLWGKTASGGANRLWGLIANSGSGTIYGGIRKEQVDRVIYTMSPEDGRIDAEVQFGTSIGFSKASATLKKLELIQNTLRQRSL